MTPDEARKVRYCVVGPTYPFRGGIAQHTTLLCSHLAERHDTRAITFKRLYPSVLFPGKSQVDNSKASVTFQAEPIIDSINPFTWAKAGKHIRAMSPDYVIIEWWHAFFGPCIGSVISNVYPAKVIFLCHNVLPHEANPVLKPFAVRALRRADGFMVHSEEQESALKELLPNAHISRTILPEFDTFPKRGIGKEEARRSLGIQGPAILFFGLVRKYKGLMDLVKAMHLLKGSGITCMVAGEFYENKAEYLSEIERLGLSGDFRIIDKYIPNEEVEEYFAASDAVVLPYKSATQSGVVQLAYQFDRPVIATSVGGLPEIVDDGRTGLLVPSENPEALALAIRRYYDESMETRLSEAVRGERGRFSWDRVIESIETLGASL